MLLVNMMIIVVMEKERSRNHEGNIQGHNLGHRHGFNVLMGSVKRVINSRFLDVKKGVTNEIK